MSWLGRFMRKCAIRACARFGWSSYVAPTGAESRFLPTDTKGHGQMPDSIRQRHTARLVGLVGTPYEFLDDKTGEMKRGSSWDAFFATDLDGGLGAIEQCKVHPTMAERLQVLGFGSWVEVETLATVSDRGKLQVRATRVEAWDDGAAEVEPEPVAAASSNGKSAK